MKRLSALLAALLLCFSLFAASVKPSMDGRAVVADIGELPIGLFAKSAAFLPGDTVVVTNPATHISIEVMIFGGFDSSEGIAIVLSPEAARELYITKGSNVIVQVTKKTDAWSENTILSKTVESYMPEDDPDVNQEIMIDDIEDPIFDKPGVMVEDVVFYVEEPILPPEEFVEIPVNDVAEEVVEESAGEPGDVVAEEIPVEDVDNDPEEGVVETSERSPLISRGSRFETEEEVEIDDTESLSEVEVSDTTSDTKWALISDDTEFVSEMSVEEEPEEDLEDDNVIESDEDIEEYLEDDDVILEEDEIEDFEIEEDDDPVEEIEYFYELEEDDEVVYELEEEDDDIVEVDDDVLVEDAGSLSEVEVSVDPEEDYIVETEVILIPTEFYPPVVELVEETADDAVVELEDDVELEEVEELIDDEENGLSDEDDMIIIADYDVEDVAEPELPAITVVSQNELPKGYYVQILTASKMTTVEDTVDMYGKNYPMQFAESARGGIQVLIGPLTPDEYAIIQARFRSYGYKDCFVRNIK